MSAVTSTVILEPKKGKSDTIFSFSPSICCEMMGRDAMIFIFENWFSYFNWSLIALQYCDVKQYCFTILSIRYTSTWISHRYTCVPPSWTPFPPSSPQHPSGLSQSTNIGCSASCIEFSLVIYFFDCWVLSFKPAFHFFPSPSSKGSLVPLHFVPLKWYHLHIWGCWCFSGQSWPQILSHLAQHFVWCTLHIS